MYVLHSFIVSIRSYIHKNFNILDRHCVSVCLYLSPWSFICQFFPLIVWKQEKKMLWKMFTWGLELMIVNLVSFIIILMFVFKKSVLLKKIRVVTFIVVLMVWLRFLNIQFMYACYNYEKLLYYYKMFSMFNNEMRTNPFPSSFSKKPIQILFEAFNIAKMKILFLISYKKYIFLC